MRLFHTSVGRACIRDMSHVSEHKLRSELLCQVYDSTQAVRRHACDAFAAVPDVCQQIPHST